MRQLRSKRGKHRENGREKEGSGKDTLISELVIHLLCSGQPRCDRDLAAQNGESRVARFPESRARNRQKLCNEKHKTESNRSNLGVPKPGCCKPGCLQLNTQKRSFAPFCGLVLALLCTHLRSFASDPVYDDCVCEFESKAESQKIDSDRHPNPFYQCLK